MWVILLFKNKQVRFSPVSLPSSAFCHSGPLRAHPPCEQLQACAGASAPRFLGCIVFLSSSSRVCLWSLMGTEGLTQGHTWLVRGWEGLEPGPTAPEAFDFGRKVGPWHWFGTAELPGRGVAVWEEHLKKVIGDGCWLRTQTRIFCSPRTMGTNSVDVGVLEHVLCTCARGFLNPSSYYDT